MSGPRIRIEGACVSCEGGGVELAQAPLRSFLDEVHFTYQRGPSCSILPERVRVWLERGRPGNSYVGMALELPPQVRTLRWADDGPPRGAKYRQVTLALPYTVLLLVFENGERTDLNQLYYRTASLSRGEELYLPNLLNSANGYGQHCWVCLVNMPPVATLPWPEKVEAIVDHLWGAGLNRSSEVHEGNSYVDCMKGLDPRLNSVDAWERASRENPLFTLEVQWKSAGTTVMRELTSMLDRVAPPAPEPDATTLAGLFPRAAAKGRK